MSKKKTLPPYRAYRHFFSQDHIPHKRHSVLYSPYRSTLVEPYPYLGLAVGSLLVAGNTSFPSYHWCISLLGGSTRTLDN